MGQKGDGDVMGLPFLLKGMMEGLKLLRHRLSLFIHANVQLFQYGV